MLYFAYCTLLDVDEMKKYCPTAEPAGIGSISGYRLCFATYSRESTGGGCNLEEAAGEEMLGLLYEMSAEALDALDSIAGVDKGYYKKIDVVVTGQDGEGIAAITYVIPEPGGPFRPSAAYTRPILAGARALQLPAEYVAGLETTIEAAQQAAAQQAAAQQTAAQQAAAQQAAGQH
jgi:gamma-glutamylcyclotransferase (GGCT)/AIG2-like uncharacterized protein YtfP